MKEKKQPKSIATINFKGGVGKTTCTWCLGDLLSTFGKSNVLLFDLDAQMSLTQAITLNEDGSLVQRFQTWADKSYKKEKTIFHAIEEYTGSGGKFDFGINFDFIYQISDKYHFIPSVEDLYWLALDVLPREKMQTFMRSLLAKITWSTNVPAYDYALFDCPPSFTLLSYSVLSVCDLILNGPPAPQINLRKPVGRKLDKSLVEMSFFDTPFDAYCRLISAIVHPLPPGCFIRRRRTWKPRQG